MGKKKSETLLLAKMIQRKYVDLFGEDSAKPQDLAVVSIELAAHFAWNIPQAKRNLEILARQCWMRLKNK
jgi:hypothetical protein